MALLVVAVLGKVGMQDESNARDTRATFNNNNGGCGGVATFFSMFGMALSLTFVAIYGKFWDGI